MAPPFFPFSTALVVAMLAMASLPYALTDVLIPPPMDDYPDFLDMVPPPDPPPFDAPPEETTVVCKTTQGPITIAVRPDWSPLGAQRCTHTHTPTRTRRRGEGRRGEGRVR